MHIVVSSLGSCSWYLQPLVVLLDLLTTALLLCMFRLSKKGPLMTDVLEWLIHSAALTFTQRHGRECSEFIIMQQCYWGS